MYVDEPGQGHAPSTIQGSTRFDRWEPGRDNQGKRGSKPSRQAPSGPGFTGLPEMPECFSTKSRAFRGVYSDLISLLPCFPTLRPWHFRANSHSPHVTKTLFATLAQNQNWDDSSDEYVTARLLTIGSLSPTPYQPVAYRLWGKAGATNRIGLQCSSLA